MFKFRYFCVEFSQCLCKMFSNGTHLGLMSKKTKRHRNCFCAASLCFVLLWMRKKENRLLASEFKDTGKILRKQEKNDYRSMKFLLSPDRAPRIYPLYRGKTDDTLPSAVRRLALQTHLCRLRVKGCEQRLRRRCGVCTQQFLDDQCVAISFHDGASAADVHQSAAAHGAQIGLKIHQRS